MSAPPDDLINDDLNEIDTLSPPQELLEMLQQFDPNEECSIDFNSILSSDTNNANPLGSLSEFNSNSASQDPSATLPQAGDFLSEMQLPPPLSPKCLEIIGKPCCSKLRYRNAYVEPSTRRDALTNENSNYQGPAVGIPEIYLNVAEQYYVGVSLATIIHEKTDCRYIHPYDLESIDNKDRNDQSNNTVWFPIVDEDRNGIKSFLDIRIVRKTEDELKNDGNLRPFSGYNLNLLNDLAPKLTSGRKIVQEYNLKKAQLAFIIGKKTNVNDRFPTILDPRLTVFSVEMELVPDKETVEDSESTESTTKSNPPPPDCRMYKYAPRRGYTEGNEDVLIFYTKKLEEKKYGNLQVTFESDTPNIDWSAKVAAADIEVKDQMVSFRTPCYPFSITELTPVKIILQQKERVLETLRYFYVPKSQCPTCQANAMAISNRIPNNSNKRVRAIAQMGDETDAVVPINGSKLTFKLSKSEPESQSSIISSNSSSRSSININQKNHDENEVLDKLNESVASLFTNNDFKPFFRICKSFIRKRPELLHNAINNNYSDLISKFIPVAQINLLQQKNQFGETVLLHAVRLNHINIVKSLLEKENSAKLLEDTNAKKQNIFHILALNTNSEEILDLFINHLLKKSINIQEKFDHVDEDNHTPLQLTVYNNNLSATRHLLKYFNKDVCETNNYTGDNLIHLAVRHGDLTMLKYLLDEGQLIEQGRQTNLAMTPIELARSMKRDDMVDYFHEIYSQPEVDEDECSDND